jgi:hypothetical protein
MKQSKLVLFIILAVGLLVGIMFGILRFMFILIYDFNIPRSKVVFGFIIILTIILLVLKIIEYKQNKSRD